MSFTDTISDMIARIKNAQKVGAREVKVRFSRMALGVLAVLKKEGFIADYDAKAAHPAREISVSLKYFEGKGVISEMQKVSKPGRRVYFKSGEIPKVHNGLGLTVLSTPKGVMSDHEARAQKLGGELLCNVF